MVTFLNEWKIHASDEKLQTNKQIYKKVEHLPQDHETLFADPSFVCLCPVVEILKEITYFTLIQIWQRPYSRTSVPEVM